MKDTKNLTLGMWIDYCIEDYNITNVKPKPKVREATQEDFDRFRKQ